LIKETLESPLAEGENPIEESQKMDTYVAAEKDTNSKGQDASKEEVVAETTLIISSKDEVLLEEHQAVEVIAAPEETTQESRKESCENTETKETEQISPSLQEPETLFKYSIDAEVKDDIIDENAIESNGEQEVSDPSTIDSNTTSKVNTKLEDSVGDCLLETSDVPSPTLEESEMPVKEDVSIEKEQDEGENEVNNEDKPHKEPEEQKPLVPASPIVEYGSVGSGSYGITYCYKKVSEWFKK